MSSVLDKSDILIIPESWRQLTDEVPFNVIRMPCALPSIIQPYGGKTMNYKDLFRSVIRFFVGDEPAPTLHEFYRYIRFYSEAGDISPFGGVAFYVRGNFTTDAVVTFSFSICHKNDQFSKAIARSTAKERYLEGEVYSIRNYDHELDLEQNLYLAIKTHLLGEQIPISLEITHTRLTPVLLTSILTRLVKTIERAWASEVKAQVADDQAYKFKNALKLFVYDQMEKPEHKQSKSGCNACTSCSGCA